MTWREIMACKEHKCNFCKQKTEDTFYVDGFYLICEDCYKKEKK